jgi:replication factor C large subunit
MLSIMPYIKKYTPQTVQEVQGQEKAIVALQSYFTHFKKGKACLVYGPPGSGKTSAVHALAAEKQVEVIEVNASDVRNKDGITTVVGAASQQQSLFSKGKLILLDEIDGLSGTKDRGGLAELTRLVTTSSFPLICTLEDPFDSKFKALRKASLLVEFEALSPSIIKTALERIAKKENLTCSSEVIQAISFKAGGDIRAALNDLQLLGNSTLDDVGDFGEREKKESIQQALLKIFKTSDPSIALRAFDYVPEDLDKCLMWIDENLPKEYEKPEEIASAYDFISRADIMQRRIRRWQYWRFLVYVNAYLSAGVAVSKQEKYRKQFEYVQSKRPLKIWMANRKYEKRKAIAEKIAHATHTSTTRALQDTLPYFQQVFKKNKEQSAVLTEAFDFSSEEVQWLRK